MAARLLAVLVLATGPESPVPLDATASRPYEGPLDAGEPPPVEAPVVHAPEPADPREPDPEALPPADAEPEPANAEPEPANAEPDPANAGPDPARGRPPRLAAPDDLEPVLALRTAILWQRAGIVATALGGALGIAAIVIGSSDPCEPAGGNSCRRSARNRTAITLGVPAVLSLGGGVTLVTLGTLRRHRLQAGLSARRDAASVWLSGRF